MSQARISMYAVLWSTLGIKFLYCRGGPDSECKILHKGGRVGKRVAKAGMAAERERMSAFGETT
jgi:hypothetical protein